MSPEKNLEVLQNFMGYGNPESNYWFIGIEEGGKWKGNDFLPKGEFDYLKDKFKEQPYHIKELTEKQLEKDRGPGTISSIKNFFGDSINSTEPNEIYKHMFMGNLLPLSNDSSNKEYPQEYKKFFGIDSRESYLDSIFFKERLDILSNFINLHIFDGSNNQKHLIFHGKTYWDYYKCFIDNCLNKKRNNFKDKDKIKYCKIKDMNVYIILTPHFSRFTLTNEMIKDI